MAARLTDRIQKALDEARMLILGAQVLLGFEFRSVFEARFEQLPDYEHYIKLGALFLMLVAVGLLIAPGAYHRIVNNGEDSESLESFTTGIMCLALLPFALGLGADTFVATHLVATLHWSIVAGCAAVGVAIFFWYGIEYYQRSKRREIIRREKAMRNEEDEKSAGKSQLNDKIKHVLTEARVVIPGAQALLGFQFATMLMDGFEKLPTYLKYIHLASLSLVAIAIIFLMTPAAYHRMVEEGEETEHFHRFASLMLLAAMVPLALGICGDFYLVVRKVTESEVFAVTAGAIMLMFFYGLWFGVTFYLRSRQQEATVRLARLVRG